MARYDALAQALERIGFFQEIQGSALHGADCCRDVSVAAEHDGGDSPMALSQTLQQFNAADLGHFQIDQQAARPSRIVSGEEGAGRIEALRLEPHQLDDGSEGFANFRFVINYENRCLRRHERPLTKSDAPRSTHLRCFAHETDSNRCAVSRANDLTACSATPWGLLERNRPSLGGVRSLARMDTLKPSRIFQPNLDPTRTSLGFAYTMAQSGRQTSSESCPGAAAMLFGY